MLLKDISDIKNEILDTALISFAAISFPSLAASLSRQTEVGWKPILTVHILIFALIMGTVLYRKRELESINAKLVKEIAERIAYVQKPVAYPELISLVRSLLKPAEPFH